ncbi:MAG: aldose 1-epimerase [Pseudacidovorax sp.]|nr:aldose 1-epimerase [Pseudacidovorax sp.]
MTELRAGRLRCELAPALGGAVAGLWRDDVPLLRSTPGAQLASARTAACLPLVPFSNRVGQAAVVWQGTQQPLVRHPGDAPHAIQGLAWQRPWSVLDEDESSAMLAYEHRADASWPFAFDCSHTIRLSPQALEMTLAVTNQSPQPAPVSLGWRALLPRAPGTRLAWHASGRWEFDLDRLPAFCRPTSGHDGDAAALPLAQAYEGWDGTVLAGTQLALRSGLTRLVVCNDPDLDCIALEPVSHAPNAVHLYAAGAPTGELGLSLLQPGESLIAQCRIEAGAA